MSLHVAIIGPGRSQQGTGPYIARAFHQSGATISGVVSSTAKSAANAAKLLKTDYGIDCRAFKDLDDLFKDRPVDIVVISSPFASHFKYLEAAIEAGCHVFCEKPLWWSPEGITTESDIRRVTEKTTRLVELCNTKGLVLQLNTQWPFTLPAYYEMYPQEEHASQTVETFSMWLSPQSTDKMMIVDAAPHLLSMLYAIAGAGRIQNIEHNHRSAGQNNELDIQFDYLHANGDIKAHLSLRPTNTFPRPAAYAIDNRRVDRHIERSSYLVALHSSDKQLPIVDPLVCSVKNFLGSIYSGSLPDEVALIDGMTHLAQLYQAVKIN